MRISSGCVTGHGSIPVAPRLEASCVSEGSGRGGWCCRVHGDSWQIAWHRGELGAVRQEEKRCVPGSLPSWCLHQISSSSSLPCFGLLRNHLTARSTASGCPQCAAMGVMRSL